MPADGGKHGGMLLAKPDRAAAALEIGADADDPGDAGRLCAFEHLGQIGGKIRVIQVRVSVVENGHGLAGGFSVRGPSLKRPGKVRNP